MFTELLKSITIYGNEVYLVLLLTTFDNATSTSQDDRIVRPCTQIMKYSQA